MNAPHFDVLIIGAGLSGIGTGLPDAAAVPKQDDRGVRTARAPRRNLGPVPLSRGPFGFGHVQLRLQVPAMAGSNVLADGASIRNYIAETAAEYGIEEKIRYGLKAVTADWSRAETPLDGDRLGRGKAAKPARTGAAT